jgi:hypothetical protein
MQDWVFYYCDGMDFFPKAPLVQMHMVINLSLYLLIETWI